jgi:hypothetical protein
MGEFGFDVRFIRHGARDFLPQNFPKPPAETKNSRLRRGGRRPALLHEAARHIRTEIEDDGPDFRGRKLAAERTPFGIETPQALGKERLGPSRIEFGSEIGQRLAALDLLHRGIQRDVNALAAALLRAIMPPQLEKVTVERA